MTDAVWNLVVQCPVHLHSRKPLRYDYPRPTSLTAGHSFDLLTTDLTIEIGSSTHIGKRRLPTGHLSEKLWYQIRIASQLVLLLWKLVQRINTSKSPLPHALPERSLRCQRLLLAR